MFYLECEQGIRALSRHLKGEMSNEVMLKASRQKDQCTTHKVLTGRKKSMVVCVVGAERKGEHEF